MWNVQQETNIGESCRVKPLSQLCAQRGAPTGAVGFVSITNKYKYTNTQKGADCGRGICHILISGFWIFQLNLRNQTARSKIDSVPCLAVLGPDGWFGGWALGWPPGFEKEGEEWMWPLLWVRERWDQPLTIPILKPMIKPISGARPSAAPLLWMGIGRCDEWTGGCCAPCVTGSMSGSGKNMSGNKISENKMSENKSLGIKCLGMKSLGIKCLGMKSLGIKCLGMKCLGIKSLVIKCLGMKCIGSERWFCSINTTTPPREEKWW